MTRCTLNGTEGVVTPKGWPVIGLRQKEFFDSLGLLRYIHFNVMRAKSVKSLEELDDCRWSDNKHLFKTEYMGPEESLALVKKKMVEYEVIMKELGRIKK
jgi:hypothetical protein